MAKMKSSNSPSQIDINARVHIFMQPLKNKG